MVNFKLAFQALLNGLQNWTDKCYVAKSSGGFQLRVITLAIHMMSFLLYKEMTVAKIEIEISIYRKLDTVKEAPNLHGF